MGLVYLAGAARRAGLDPEIYDAMAKGEAYPKIEERLRHCRASYVASSAITSTSVDAVRTLKLAKSVHPATVTILGGVHATFMYREILEESSAVDYVVLGEGEETLRLLLEALERGEDPSFVAGLAYRGEDGSVVTTGRGALLRDLDELPAAWDLLHWEDYTYLPIPGSRLGAIGTSRGCDRDCGFCSQQQFWEKSWRGRDPQSVADELEWLHRNFQVDVFMIVDEYPTRDRERWEALLDAVIAKQLPVHLLMETRATDILRDRDIIAKYREAGVIYLSLGIETADASGDGVKKELEPPLIKEVLETLREVEIVSETSLIIGSPGETLARIRETMQLVQECNPDIANFMAYTPWPYGDRYLRERALLDCEDYRKFNLVDAVLQPREMTTLQVEVALADCYRRFYMGKMIDYMTMKAGFRRDYLMRLTKLFMGSSFVLRKMGIGLFGKIPAKIDGMVKKRNSGE